MTRRFGSSVAPHLNPGTAHVFLPCFGVRFLPEVFSDPWEMLHVLWDLPPSLSGAPTVGPGVCGGMCSKEDKATALLTPWGEHTQEFGQKGQVSHWQRLSCQCQQGVEVANFGVLSCAPSARHSLHPSPGRDGEKRFLPAGNLRRDNQIAP